MATGNSVNDEIREQHGKMKGKSFKEKAAYFWEYYKIHTLVVILVIAFGGNLIYTIVTQKAAAMEAAFVNVYLQTDFDVEQAEADIAAYLEINTEEYEVVLDTGLNVDYEGTDEYSAANLQKLMAMVAANSLDAIITDDSYLEHNVESGMFSDLTEVFSDETLSKYEDRLLYRDVPDDDKGEVPIAINISDCKYLITDQVNTWFTISATATHPEEAELFLEYLMKP